MADSIVATVIKGDRVFVGNVNLKAAVGKIFRLRVDLDEGAGKASGGTRAGRERLPRLRQGARP